MDKLGWTKKKGELLLALGRHEEAEQLYRYPPPPPPPPFPHDIEYHIPGTIYRLSFVMYPETKQYWHPRNCERERRVKKGHCVCVCVIPHPPLP